MKYLTKYYDHHDRVDIDLNNQNSKAIEELLDNLVDITICPHLDRLHRARFMCHTCYHRRGNLVKAWKCSHSESPHHSNGLCKLCYH